MGRRRQSPAPSASVRKKCLNRAEPSSIENSNSTGYLLKVGKRTIPSQLCASIALLAIHWQFRCQMDKKDKPCLQSLKFRFRPNVCNALGKSHRLVSYSAAPEQRNYRKKSNHANHDCAEY